MAVSTEDIDMEVEKKSTQHNETVSTAMDATVVSVDIYKVCFLYFLCFFPFQTVVKTIHNWS